MVSWSVPGASQSPSTASDIQIAWCAGVLEGEGTFRVSSRGGVQISCSMTDGDIIERLQGIMGGRYGTPSTTKGGKTLYPWHMSMREDVVPWLEALHPHMGIRRGAKIQELLDYHIAHPKTRRRPTDVSQAPQEG